MEQGVIMNTTPEPSGKKRTHTSIRVSIVEDNNRVRSLARLTDP